MATMIRRCAELHMRQIAPGRRSVRDRQRAPARLRPLVGAQAREPDRATALRHGEAVAIGMALDARYSVARGPARAGRARSASCALLERLGFRLWHDGARRPRAPTGSSRRPRGAARVPRAPRRRAHRHAARAASAAGRGARDRPERSCARGDRLAAANARVAAMRLGSAGAPATSPTARTSTPARRWAEVMANLARHVPR